MTYSYSQTDKSNSSWFHNDNTNNTLLTLTVQNGSIRGVGDLKLSFEYPITAIVGENGAGKSTLLSLVCCAFHNNTSYFPQNRIRPNVKRPRCYYTYGDFFTFSPGEAGIAGIEIISTYLSTSGIRQDIRRKRPSGKWNDFNCRPSRAVAFLGINRIVPPSESGPHKHYYRNFVVSQLDPNKITQLKSSMSYIIGKNYTDIELMSYSSYKLFEATRDGLTYTGFNMGAGENAVLGLLLEILSAGNGALIVVDEIELGLHTQAQIRLISELKKLCLKYKCQIVCSTHSKEVLEQLPPESRIFLKRDTTRVIPIPKISSEYAFGKLAGVNSKELEIIVEDEIAKSFILNSLPNDIRERIAIIPAGADQAVLRHIAVHYREKKNNFLVFLDGDKRNNNDIAITQVNKLLETHYNEGDTQMDVADFTKKRLHYLPGDVWPEKVFIVSILSKNIQMLEGNWCASETDVKTYLTEALCSEKHKELFAISQKTCLPVDQVCTDIIRCYAQQLPDEIAPIIKTIQDALDNNS